MSEVNRTQNRGVNITSEDFAQVELENDAAVPQSRLKLDLHNIIDFIDTNTPHFRYTSSSLDADNEESLISSAPSIRSAVRHQSDSQNDTLELVSHGSESCNTITELSCEKSLGIPTPILYSTNTNCPCLHSKGPLPQFPVNSKVPYRKVYNGKEKRFMLPDLFEKWVGKDRKDTSTPEELYRINIQTKDECSPPTRLVFDLIEVVPKHVTSTGTNTKHIARENLQKNGIKCKYAPMGCNVQHSNYSGVVVTPRNTTKWKYPNWYKNLHKQRVNHKKPKPNPTRMDVYYFDHGNAAYYQTTDSPPTITTELVAEKTESYAKKFWAEIFGTLYIGCAFITSFILQFFRLILHAIIRPLTISMLQLMSDYFLKPCLVTAFNAIVQPPIIFIYNIATSLRDLCDPISEGIGYFIREVSVLCKSIRLFEVKRDNSKTPATCSKCNVSTNCNAEELA